MKSRSFLSTAAALLFAGALTAQSLDSVSSASKAKSAAAALQPSVTLVSTADGAKSTVRVIGTLRGGQLSAAKAGTSSASSGQLMVAKAGSTISINGQLASTKSGGSTVMTPGQTIFLGPTTGTTSTATLRTLANRGTAASTDVVVVSAAAPEGLNRMSSASLSANPSAAAIERQIFQGDLARDVGTLSVTSSVSAVAAAEAGTGLLIGANGFPVPITTDGAQTAAPAIGPNGFPLLTGNGPQSGIQPIGANGFPVTTVAPFVQTGLTRAGTATTLPTAISTGATGTAGRSLPAAAAGTTTTGTAATGSPTTAATSGTSGSSR